MIKNTRTRSLVFGLAALAMAASSAAQPDGPQTRYRVFEVVSPSETDPQCLAGHGRRINIAGVSSRGLVGATASCYTQVDTGNGAMLAVPGGFRAFAWTRAAGAYDLPFSDASNSGSAFNVDSAGTIYGWETTPEGLQGVRWPRGGGIEMVLGPTPDCFFNVSMAMGGNAAGSVMGYGFRQDPQAEFPNPFSCIFAWVFRAPSGEEIVGPASNVSPTRMNGNDVVVGAVNGSATRWSPLTGEIVTLDQSSPGFASFAVDINERDVVVGWTAVDAGLNCYSDSVATVWNRRNEARTLPNLPRMGASEAWAIDEHGTIVGNSSSGDNCGPAQARGWERSRAVIWRDDRPRDLNKQIEGHPGVTLTGAAFINRRGEILSIGYRNAEPLRNCPEAVFPEDGSPAYNVAAPCRDMRAYLLVPLDCED